MILKRLQKYLNVNQKERRANSQNNTVNDKSETFKA
jgi:hypothetical protein